MSTTVTIKGLNNLTRKFHKLQKAAQGRILENAVTAGCLPIQNAAVVKAPVETGTLRRSIHTEIISSSESSVRASVGTDVEYAPYQEFGTVHIPAHPYLRPAFDEQKNNAKNEIAAALKAQIENVS